MQDENVVDLVDGPISPEEWKTGAWSVISSFFNSRGLVRQQLDSFDYFVTNTLQRVVSGEKITLYPPVPPSGEKQKIEISFGQLNIVRYPRMAGTTSDLYPHEARLRGLSYCSTIHCMVKQRTVLLDDSGTELHELASTEKRIPLGDIPIMLKSKYCILGGKKSVRDLAEMAECQYDQGGYFIVKGNEKVLVAQERMSSNYVYVFPNNKDKSLINVEIRSAEEDSVRPPGSFLIRMERPKKSSNVAGKVLRASLPYVKEPIPVFILFRALGIKTDKNIFELCCWDLADPAMMEILRPSLDESFVIQDQNVALEYIANRGNTERADKARRIKFAKEILQKELLPHMGTEEGCETGKAYFIGYMIRQLMSTHLGRRDFDDRDHFGNKRMDLAGPLMGSLFRQLFRKLLKETQKTAAKMLYDKKELRLEIAIDSKIISGGLKYSLATGNWAAERKGGPPSKTGVSQVLHRLTYASTLSHLRRLNTPLGRDGKLAAPRQLHNTHWGMICPAETPEGHSCGLVKNLSLMAHITVGQPASEIKEHLMDNDLQLLTDVSMADIYRFTKVFVNGAWVGFTAAPQNMVQYLRYWRRTGHELCAEASVIWDMRERELRVYTDAGRICRPLLIVDKSMDLRLTRRHLHLLQPQEDGSPAPLTWELMLAPNEKRCPQCNRTVHSDEQSCPECGGVLDLTEGVIEFIDTHEEETLLIAMSLDQLVEEARECQERPPLFEYTHMEIHPSMILGILASIIPFPDHNQSPRNCYQSAMGKQAIGIYITNYLERMDSNAYVLMYPQRPLVQTAAMQYLYFPELPAGCNSTVAIMIYSGYNQEDSNMMSQAAVDRGFFRTISYRCYIDREEKKVASAQEEFERPSPQTTKLKGQKGGVDIYADLDQDGFVAPGTRLLGGSMVIGKTVPINRDLLAETTDARMSQQTKACSSTPLKRTEEGVVDRVMLATDEDKNRLVKVRMRSVRIPQVGDKFSSRHGQKGTMGISYRQEDMPWTVDGVTPDIIINTHAIPSRMTIAQLLECLLGKYAAMGGVAAYATPFETSPTVSDISNDLHREGFQRHGNERLMSGHSGLMLESHIFIGPTFYQRLKHMVDDKIHSRAHGPVTSLVRQPMEGRARQGGLRFGEMERDCMISHGTAHMLRDRTFHNSDKYRVHVCDICGLIAEANLEKNSYTCRGCKKPNVSQVDIPYACKLLFQELMFMCIAPRMKMM